MNDNLDLFAIYDSGSNVSLINSKLVNLKQEKIKLKRKVNLRTINGVYKSKELIKIKARILNIEKYIDVFVIDNENFKHDFLIGLDCIRSSNLSKMKTCK